MTRISKKQERRSISPRRPRLPGPKTGPKQDHLPKGYREHHNAVSGETATEIFIPKVG